MTSRHLRRTLTRSERGFTIVEMLISTMVMMLVTGAVFDILNPAQGTFQAQPEVSDMQQRMRVGADNLSRDIVMAGAGTYTGASAGALLNFFAPVMPYRMGDVNPDPKANVFYRPDTISVMYVPPTPAQTTVNKTLGNNSAEIDVDAQLNCGPDKHDALCGFENGMRVLIFDPSGNFDPMTITNVQDSALHLQHNQEKLSTTYGSDAVITQVAAHTYYLKTDKTTKTFQLMHYDGAKTDLPVLDNVVKLEFEYFGDPQPPRLLPNVLLTNPKGPWTTYGPKPPPLGVDRTSDNWPAGENCLFLVDANGHQPRLPVLGGGGVGQVKLDPAILRGDDDGPWCADATKTIRFDADLLRIRRVRVTLRVQVALEALRGPASALFMYGGMASSAERFIPDQEIKFDITPRNMNLGR
jgi:hypothetical protein